jgi:hypothetical protein
MSNSTWFLHHLDLILRNDFSCRSESTEKPILAVTDMQKSIQPGKLTYVGNWYYYFGQRKLLKPPTREGRKSGDSVNPLVYLEEYILQA